MQSTVNASEGGSNPLNAFTPFFYPKTKPSKDWVRSLVFYFFRFFFFYSALIPPASFVRRSVACAAARGVNASGTNCYVF